MYGVTEAPWNDAHFLTLGATAVDPETRAADLLLSHPDGSAAALIEELEGADMVVLLATEGSGEGAAEVIARECFDRRIMCAGLALAQGRGDRDVSAVVNAMRRFARVLVVAMIDVLVVVIVLVLALALMCACTGPGKFSCHCRCSCARSALPSLRAAPHGAYRICTRLFKTDIQIFWIMDQIHNTFNEF